MRDSVGNSRKLMPLCFQSPAIWCGGMHERSPFEGLPTQTVKLARLLVLDRAVGTLPSQEGKEDAGSCWPRMTPCGMCDHLAKPILESLGDSYRLMILNDDSMVLNGSDLF